MQYRALTGLSYPTDPAIIKRLQAGEPVPWEERQLKHAAKGQIVDDLPPGSVWWLQAQGLIEPIEPAEEDADGDIWQR